MAENFYTVVQRAVADISEAGFDTESRLEYWLLELRKSAVAYLMPEHEMTQRLREALSAIYSRLVEKGQYAKYHPGIGQFTVHKLRPQLRAELDKRIFTSAQLIKLNREESINATLQRFQGWATSIPAGGQRTSERAEAAKNIKKSLQSLPFRDRRCLIDQGQKLTASINKIIAEDGGAIAGRWRSHAGEAGYNARPEHAKRNDRVYLIRDSWAHKAGLVKPGPDGYTDQITEPGQEISCRCYYVWIYTVGRLPPEMVTAKGREEMGRIRA